jgi:hypothetical protein
MSNVVRISDNLTINVQIYKIIISAFEISNIFPEITRLSFNTVIK